MPHSGLQQLQVEGAGLAVRVAGERTKPALLLLHGFPSSSASFRDVIGPLAKSCFGRVGDRFGPTESRQVRRDRVVAFPRRVERASPTQSGGTR